MDTLAHIKQLHLRTKQSTFQKWFWNFIVGCRSAICLFVCYLWWIFRLREHISISILFTTLVPDTLPISKQDRKLSETKRDNLCHIDTISHKNKTQTFTFPPLGTHYSYTWYIFHSPLRRRNSWHYSLPLCKLEKWPNLKILCCIYLKFVIINWLFRRKHIASIYQDILQKTFKSMACIIWMSLFLYIWHHRECTKYEAGLSGSEPTPTDHSLKVEAAILQVGCKNSVLGNFPLEL